VYLNPTRASFAATAMPAAQDTPIVRAALGYDAGVIGAAALMLTR
jgi:predicted NBD/HSP70 family sugar kinase